MKKKEGTAMVEMGDPEAVQRVVSNLNRTEIWGSKLLMDVSRSMINSNNQSRNSDQIVSKVLKLNSF